jgi:hypothetical protein
MKSHVVLYITNPNNQTAAGKIVATAKELLGPIALELGAVFHASIIPPPTRVVSGTIYQVVLNFIFPSESSYASYMVDARHMQFVRFVLRGWMLLGSKASNPEDEFINHILTASADAPLVEWARNAAISETEVVWAGELVVDS